MDARVETKQDYAYRILKERILDGEYLPGERIIANRVAEEIGTSPIPVREALVRLESERLVTIKPHAGAIASLLTKDTVAEMLQNLAVLEGYATRLAHAKAHLIVDRLTELNHAMERAMNAEDWIEFSNADRLFHFSVYDVCDNQAVVRTISSLWTQLDSHLSNAAFNLIPDRARGSVAEHDGVVKMLRDPGSDGITLELLARQHKMNAARTLKNL